MNPGGRVAIDVLLWWVFRGLCRVLIRPRLRLRVEGLEHVPCSGAVLIACRHFHHFYDGCVLLAALPRPTHLMVGLDWAQDRWSRGVLEWATGVPRWPAVLRPDRLGERQSLTNGAYRAGEGGRTLRRALRLAVALLRADRALVIFPEAYPNVDPVYTPKAGDEDFLPFRPGIVKLARLAQRDGRTDVTIVPAGLHYERGQRWTVTLRFGRPVAAGGPGPNARLVERIEGEVRALSRLG